MPTAPERDTLTEIADRIRRRSVLTARLASTATMSIQKMHGVRVEPENATTLALVIQGALEKAVDETLRSVVDEIATMADEIQRLTEQRDDARGARVDLVGHVQKFLRAEINETQLRAELYRSRKGGSP